MRPASDQQPLGVFVVQYQPPILFTEESVTYRVIER
jgi:hypothetical protein